MILLLRSILNLSVPMRKPPLMAYHLQSFHLLAPLITFAGRVILQYFENGIQLLKCGMFIV